METEDIYISLGKHLKLEPVARDSSEVEPLLSEKICGCMSVVFL